MFATNIPWREPGCSIQRTANPHRRRLAPGHINPGRVEEIILDCVRGHDNAPFAFAQNVHFADAAWESHILRQPNGLRTV
jgi:hypothetical protein